MLFRSGGIKNYFGKSAYSIAINQTIPYLKANGIKKIDYLILSHGDYDHMGEGVNIINNYPVHNVIFNSGSNNELELELIKLLDKKNTVSTWLHDYCDSGVSGRLFRSRINNETLFIPANGFISGNASYQNGLTCSLWTSSLDFSSVYNCTDFIGNKFNAYISTTCAYYVCMGIRGVFNTFWIK